MSTEGRPYNTQMRGLGRGVQVQVQEEWRMYHKTLNSDTDYPLPKKKERER